MSQRPLPPWQRPWVPGEAEDPARGSLPPFLLLSDLWSPRVGVRML